MICFAVVTEIDQWNKNRYVHCFKPTFLKLCPHIRPGQQRNPIDFGHWVKGQGHWGQMCQNCFRLVLQNICDKKIL